MNFIIKEGNINDIEKIIEVCKTIGSCTKVVG